MFTKQTMQPSVAKRQLKKWKIINTYPLFAVLITIVLFSSCQKKISGTELTSNTDVSAEVSTLNPNPSGRNSATKYGALIGVPDSADDLGFQVHIAHNLSITCLRETVIVPSKFAVPNLVPELNTKYKVLLNFNSPGKGLQTVPFVTDFDKYKKDLNDILQTFTVMPVVAAIENEESNRFYYSGTAQQYINQLSAAIDVMHARGIKVTNGGITKEGLNYLVYEDLLRQGKTDSAQQFQVITNVYPDSPSTQNRAAFIDTLLPAYKTMNIDFVNFHWKDSTNTTQALNQVINYLKKRTNKKIITTEIGQFDLDPNTLLTHVQLCTDQQFPYIMWYSPDVGKGKRDKPLQYSNGTLTPSGYAYQGYLRQ